VDELDLITYLRPSRYCESDSLGPTAASEFAGLHEEKLLAAVSGWVADKLTYVAGSSLPTDGAVRTLLGRQGVCRDFAHLSVALLRALNVPARLAAVFAPGLSPMEYHAVCEAYVNGAWYIIDGTRLAPRQSLLRVATGRDAADTAFLTNLGGGVQLSGLEVTAVVDDFPWDCSWSEHGSGQVCLTASTSMVTRKVVPKTATPTPTAWFQLSWKSCRRSSVVAVNAARVPPHGSGPLPR
jgi:transglutaminase-like putative cysteine protease